MNHLRLLAVTALVLVGCNGKPEVDFTRISIGMTKEQVVERIGQPTRMSSQGGLEVFEYEAWDKKGIDVSHYNLRFLFVRFLGGKVDSFGRKGDFDSTKNPTTEQKITTISEHPRFDLAAEIKRLDKMKADGLLTADEYAQLRKNAIEKAKIL